MKVDFGVFDFRQQGMIFVKILLENSPYLKMSLWDELHIDQLNYSQIQTRSSSRFMRWKKAANNEYDEYN